jgi:hypothetical protein
VTTVKVEAYPLAEATTASRRMQQARHIGKIVLRMPNPLQPRRQRRLQGLDYQSLDSLVEYLHDDVLAADLAKEKAPAEEVCGSAGIDA